MRVARTGSLQLDPTLLELILVLLRAVGPVALDDGRTLDRATELALHRRDGVHQRHQLRDIVSVGAGEQGCQRQACGVGDDVMFGACFSAVYRAWACLRAPFIARTDELSTSARDQSIWPA